MLFIVNLSNQKAMFNNLLTHNELKDVAKLSVIRDSLIAIIDEKKMGENLSESNTVSIERDDFCSICMCDLDTQIEKCTCCSHVMHISCITSWWDLSNSWNNHKGKCPYCKSPIGFSHIKHKDEDPWKLFDFHEASEASEAVDQPIPEQLQPEEDVDQPIFDVAVGNPPFQFEIINQLRETLSFITGFRNLNMNDPYIQNLDSRLESLQQEHDSIQNAFQAQPH
jgi:hypothetical protein